MTLSYTLVTLSTELGATLSQEEADQVKQLLFDALGEFVSARGGVTGEGPAADLRDALKYVRERYPGLAVAEQQRKAEQVIRRKQLARKLRAAANNVKVTDLPKSYLDEILASLREKSDAVDAVEDEGAESVEDLAAAMRGYQITYQIENASDDDDRHR